MKETIKNLKKVYLYGKEFKKNIIFEILCSIIRIITAVIVPLLAAKQIEYLTNNIWEKLIYISIAMVGITIIQNLNTVFFRKNTQIYRRGTVKNIQIALSNNILEIQQSELDKMPSSVFVQRIVNDTDKMSSIFTSGISILTSVLSSIGSFIAVFIIDKTVFLFYLCASLILTILHLIKTKKYGKKDYEYRQEQENVVELTNELIRGTRDIKMLNAKKSFINNLKTNIDKQINKNFEMRNVEIKYNFFIDTLTTIFEFILIILLIVLLKTNTISITIALALLSYKSTVMTNIMEKISNLLTELNNFNISCNRVFAILDNVFFKTENFGTSHIDNVKGNISFKNVDFSYKEGIDILNNLNFDIKAGETIGFVGKSGVGKSTIFNLLCKLYETNNGKITIENIDINELDEKTIRSNITVISQNPYIFNMSIRDNLRLIKEDLTEKEMINACKMACLDDFIQELPDKYDTILGENGINLSGGQKQRLAIARALIQNTKIILFDEATSALDNETQAKIQQIIEKIKKDYTILIIAHRLSTIVNCDKILILEKGRIIDSGTHYELLKKNKTYKKLCETELIKKEN